MTEGRARKLPEVVEAGGIGDEDFVTEGWVRHPSRELIEDEAVVDGLEGGGAEGRC